LISSDENYALINSRVTKTPTTAPTAFAKSLGSQEGEVVTANPE